MLKRARHAGVAAALALLILPADGIAWKLDVKRYGAGVVDEITPRNLIDCSVGLFWNDAWTHDGTETTCTAGTTKGPLYSHGDVIELRATVPDELSKWGWHLERWVDGTKSEQVNCDPQSFTGNQWAGTYGDTCKFAIFGDRWVEVYFADHQRPVTTLDDENGPSGVTTSKAAQFKFAADEPGSTFKCSLSWPGHAGTPTACATGHDYADLADDAYTFTVDSFDPSGNHGHTRSRVWRVDTTPPAITIAGGPTAGQQTESSSAGFDVSTTDKTATTVHCTLDGHPRNCGDTFTNLPDGPHTFSVTAKDVVNNTSTLGRTWIVDRVAPETTITGGPADSLPTSSRTPFTFISSEAGTFWCSLDNGPFTTCSTPHSLPGLADGRHIFQVRAADPYGHMDSSPAARVWTLDTTPPETTVTDGPADRSVVSTNSVEFGFGSPEAGAVFECRVDASEFSACTSPFGATLPDGDHVFEVRGRDAAGNVDGTPARRSWRVSVPESDGDGDGTTRSLDCDDADAARRPGAYDIPANGVDENCDGRDADYPIVSAGISYQWFFKGPRAWPALLKVTRVLKGSTVTVTCRGKGCPFKSRKLQGNGKTLDLKGLFNGRKLKRGAKVKIVVAAPGTTAKIVSFKVRHDKTPSGGKYRCRRPGASSTIACPG
jgi:hypothetical protein